ncbi:MAG: hypothetical protein Q8R28_01230, partial [Dehalococcoidia bacterium]|nr:hypothetical protein [Dehalococcoidia bacterium]
VSVVEDNPKSKSAPTVKCYRCMKRFKGYGWYCPKCEKAVKEERKNPTNWVEGTGPASDSEYRGQMIRAGRVQRTAANPGNRGNDPLLCPSCNESMGDLPAGDYRHNPCGAKVRVGDNPEVAEKHTSPKTYTAYIVAYGQTPSNSSPPKHGTVRRAAMAQAARAVRELGSQSWAYVLAGGIVIARWKNGRRVSI